jgi:hypothetical protein
MMVERGIMYIRLHYTTTKRIWRDFPLDKMQQNIVLVASIVLVGIIAVAVVVANLGLAGESPIVSGFATWGQVPVLGAIVAMAIGIWKGLFNESKDLIVSVKFPIPNVKQLKWNVNESKYVAYDRANNEVVSGTVQPIPPEAGDDTSVLICTLPSEVFASHYIKMTLEEEGGKKWRVSSFHPNTKTEEAMEAT